MLTLLWLLYITVYTSISMIQIVNVEKSIKGYYDWPSLLFYPGSFPRVLISPMATKTVWRICIDHIQLWVIVYANYQSQTKVAIIPTNVQPMIIENDVRFSGLGLSQRENWNHQHRSYMVFDSESIVSLYNCDACLRVSGMLLRG